MLINVEESMKNRRVKKRAVTGFGVVLVFVLAFVAFFYLSFQTVVVRGESMEPTFRTGRRLLVTNAYWLVGDIRQNDIVVIRGDLPKEYIIKRVHRLGGEKVDFANAPPSWDIRTGEFVVPKGYLYVIGDNREVSEDSRKFGPVEAGRVLGKVVIVR